MPYTNRELSWLDFNARVLHEAIDERNPLLERARFLAIFASNLDEFFQVRVAGVKQQMAAGGAQRTPDGLSPAETLRRDPRQGAAARGGPVRRVGTGAARARRARRSGSSGWSERPERHLELRQRFIDEIFPVLTPLAVDPGHPFPYISDLSLSLAVTVRDPETGERRFARIKVPPVLPRLVEVGQFAPTSLLEQVIAENLDILFPGHGDPRAPPVPRDAQRRPRDRGGRGRRPAARHPGGASPAALRRGGPPGGGALDAGRDAGDPRARPAVLSRGRLRGRRDAGPDGPLRDRRSRRPQPPAARRGPR